MSVSEYYLTDVLPNPCIWSSGHRDGWAVHTVYSISPLARIQIPANKQARWTHQPMGQQACSSSVLLSGYFTSLLWPLAALLLLDKYTHQVYVLQLAYITTPQLFFTTNPPNWAPTIFSLDQLISSLLCVLFFYSYSLIWIYCCLRVCVLFCSNVLLHFVIWCDSFTNKRHYSRGV